MKTSESITESEIEKLTADIGADVTKRLRQYAAEKQEQSLMILLRISGKPKKEQVLEYLQRTERKTIRNQYVAEHLWIDTCTLKQIRAQLEKEGKIVVYMEGGVIHLRASAMSPTTK